MSSLVRRPVQHVLPNLNNAPRRAVYTGVRRVLGGIHGMNASLQGSDLVPEKANVGVLDGSRKSPQPLQSDNFRSLLRQIPRPVVVVTSIDFPRTPAEEEYDDKNHASSPAERDASASSTAESHQIQRANRPLLRAMTVSSFSSVAISPRRLVSLSIERPSRCFDAIQRSGRLNIHVLRSSPEGARLAKYFSQPRHPPPGEPDLGFSPSGILSQTGASTVGEWDSTWNEMRRSRTLPDSPERTQKPMGDPSCVPLLRSDGVLYTLRCVIAQSGTASSGHIHLDNATLLIGEVLDCQLGGDKVYYPEETALMHAQKRYHKLGEPFPTSDSLPKVWR